jgi:hypothetical protein
MVCLGNCVAVSIKIDVASVPTTASAAFLLSAKVCACSFRGSNLMQRHL